MEEHETYVGLRAQKTPPLGTRPAALRGPGLQLFVEHAARAAVVWAELDRRKGGGGG